MIIRLVLSLLFSITTFAASTDQVMEITIIGFDKQNITAINGGKKIIFPRRLLGDAEVKSGQTVSISITQKELEEFKVKNIEAEPVTSKKK